MLARNALSTTLLITFSAALAVSLSGCSSPAGNPNAASLSSNTVATQVNSSVRPAADRARDHYRHPAETLTFFQLEPHHTVVEIWPGAGWYSRILAPYLRDKGRFIAAHWAADSPVTFFRNSRAAFDREFVQSDQPYGPVHVRMLEPPRQNQLTAEIQADRILTFRNVHNWMRNDQEQAMFNSMFVALKAGGVLGVVEHRAPPQFSRAQMIESGYVSEAYVQKLAEKAGFILEASSEINANPADSKNYPAGVWTLPPTLRLGETDKARYLAVGESDRMTLRFRKPL
ncbi:class I SAM-dependent methyltransferase [Thalassolituus sp. ST750PaO-4]|uniref:class I SAM-dependent methyltransferase n=1 Tax=Thalassolituus sp. ST750PaO-4 TaxID=2742965 RepID=UPI001CE2DF03|nr:methyltransferase [Thalassolituus sp. ST750PaO-4]MCA6061594.1 class I SAM-dependent methyltransferase [Thalassolituus sp. ST750PaO-4]